MITTQRTPEVVDLSLYQEGSTHLGWTTPKQLNPNGLITLEPSYDRSLMDYEIVINEPATDSTLFQTRDWQGKTVLDIGAGGRNLFALEARHYGVRVASINPALADPDHRETLLTALMELRSTSDTDHSRSAAIKALRYLFGKHLGTPAGISSVAALGQELPFADGSFDGIVSVFGVPHYLHHTDPSILYDQDKITAYTPEVREKDKLLILHALQEVLRVLKPNGMAYLRDNHRASDQTTNINGYSPSDGTEVLEAIALLPHTKSEVHAKRILDIGGATLGIARTVILIKAP